MQKVVVLTGAGISAESGISTFRDSGGLWEGYDVNEVATPEGFAANPTLVLDFYNGLRRQLRQAVPNEAHRLLAQLEKRYHVVIITQNVDDLHERAGSHNIIHLHGELLKSRGVDDPNTTFPCPGDIHLGDKSPSGAQLRPHIVWFGEEVPMLEKAIAEVYTADILMIIGTSLQVYPAAGLMDYVKEGTPIFYIDPHPSLHSKGDLTVIAQKASTGVAKAIELIRTP
ncbi:MULTISPECIES: SIR2 family NAD-dependent protein deacylase [unclassified Capnocytophaga]|jgi:NAD-dependent protein deacetylases, SIR2 family|uniref:SIR2 family NAD-dependent protein deacylase n=1 Tax=unclassified Capnocytophaga TaxID=2640652 RepID=UPI000202F4B8|nr:MULTISPECIES: NAD-dependent deacylase [unclassified Capnocytophaga]EGD34761.1 SIR2 family NAD-dependent deacetylase [Capnocytophaga sp. oral taxon 338 str. F0234]MEB3005143.1 NAD-dependent deacylase [Capnocytophaga sp. G2]